MAEDELKVRITGDASQLGGALDKAGGQVANFSVKISKIGKTATIAGAAITAAFVKTFLDFTAYETRLVDMAKVTGESFDQIEEKIKSIDPILGSSTKLMEGYYQVISAGVKDPVKALETLTVASQAAKAAHTEQSEVVKGITKMMAGYEGAIKNAAEAADLLFAIEKEGQTTVAELIPVIGSLAKTSSDLNIKQTAMAASMAVISKTAGSTAEAATQYQAVLTGLMKPTEDMTAAMEDMGYKTAELALEEEGLVEVLKHLREYSERTGVSMAKLFGRKEAMLGFSALGAEGFRVLDETIVSVGEGMGGAERAFDEWSETGAAAIDKIKSTFLNFSIMIGEKVAPMIKDVLGKVTDVITKVIEWADENEELTEKLFTFGLALGAALAVLGPIAIMLPSLIAGFTLLAPAMLPLAVGGAIVLGIKKLSEYLRETVGGMREFRIELGLMELDAVNVEIQELIVTLEQLQVRFYEIPKGIGRQQVLTMVDELNKRLEMLYKRREELTKAEKEGIDVAKEKLKLDEEAKRLMDELAEREKEAKKALDEKIKSTETMNALKEIENSIFKLTHTALEIAIRDLELQKQRYIDLGVEIELVNKLFDLQMTALFDLNKTVFKCGQQFMKLGEDVVVAGYKLPTKEVFLCGQAFLKLGEDVVVMGDELPKLEDKFEDLEDTAKPVIARITGYLENQLAGAISNLLSQTEDFEWSWSKFWEGLKNTLINAVAAMIAKLVILASFSWLFSLLNLPLSWLPWEKGGGVGYDKGGKVKGYQPGGGVDTIPARLTIGEYVIDKPMTDFIRRFKAFPANLIDAIVRGMPTPAPAFAGGGLVGNPNVSTTGFGETNINVYITGNKISDDIDIKKLAATVSDEILRKLNGKRRH